MTGDDVEAFTRETVDLPRSLVTTDEYPGYGRLDDIVAHRVINHSVAYVDWDMFAGAVWPDAHQHNREFLGDREARFRRSVSRRQRRELPLYLRELSYRYNLRHGGCDLDGVLHLAIKP